MVARELTREEKAAIRKLVTRLCANYDRDVGCLGISRCGRPCPGNPALPGMRQGLSPGWPDTVLLPRLRQGRKAQKAAGLYAEIPGMMR